METRIVDGVVLEVRLLKRGRTFTRWEVRKLDLNGRRVAWPTTEAMLKAFGECGFGGLVKTAGPVGMVEVYVD